MRGWPRYAQYKASGVEWLGDVPEHWETWKVTHGFQLIGSGTTPKSDNADLYDGDTPWVTTSELRESVIYDTAQKVSDDAIDQYSALKKYPVGSVAIAMYGATIGRLGILGVEATFNQACCVFAKPIVFYNRFFYYWLWMRRPILISLSNGGGQPNLSQDDLKKIWIPAPSITEQTAIAQFLDQKTAQIDALISKKQQLLEKLAEQRTALISHAVTKGLDPNAPMKDSGVAWLGEVPEHWEITPLKWHSNCSSGENIKNETLLKNSDEQNNIGAYGGNGFMGYTDSFNVKAPVLIVGRVGALCGNVHLLTNNAWVSDNALILRVSERFCLEFLTHVLRSRDLNTLASKTAQPLITSTQVCSEKIPLPPNSEQTAITQFLDQKTAELDQMAAKVKAVIDKLKEYRAALITQAVTGQIDVRQCMGD